MLSIVSLARRIKPDDKSKLDRFRPKTKKRWWRFLALIVLAIIVWYGANILIALNRVTTPNSNAGGSALKEAVNRGTGEPINILLIGIGGQSHPGGTLADSIMVASIDPKEKTISLLSVPRDLYVTIPGVGKQKINSAHSIGETQNKTGGGPALIKQVVSDTLGVPIHYFIRIDFDGFKKIIDTLGGVTVDVKIPINDPLFPDSQLKGFEPFSIKAGKQKLDGTTALKYVRSRETTSDFDRARRQQEVILAIKEKALSAQILANPKKVNNLISTVGKHLLTDFSASELDVLIKLARELENPTINRQVLGSDENGLLTSGRAPNGASIIIPKAGMNDFSEIQLFVKSFFAKTAIEHEKATIRLERAGATKETVTKVSKQLELAGFVVSTTDTTGQSSSSKTALTSLKKDEKSRSLSYLNDAYRLKPKDNHKDTTVDYILTLGSDFISVTKSTSRNAGGEKEHSERPLTTTRRSESSGTF